MTRHCEARSKLTKSIFYKCIFKIQLVEYFDHRSGEAQPMMAAFFSPILRLMQMKYERTTTRLSKYNRISGQG